MVTVDRPASAQQATSAPNIIVVLFDDLGYADTEPYGSTTIETPHMTALAAEGMRFTQFYAASASCSPARAALMTGRHPLAVGFRRNVKVKVSERGLPIEVPTIAEAMLGAGYATAHFGSWHIGNLRPEQLPHARGFEHSELVVRPGDGTREFLVNGVETRTYPGHIPDVVTDRALEYLAAERDRPVYIQLWYSIPHAAWVPPPEWAARYPDTPDGRYAGEVSFGDEQIGRLVQALNQLGLDEQTLLIVTGDNGGTHNGKTPTGPLRGQKGGFYEGGIRVPLLARWPGTVPAGRVNSGVAASVDLFPTLLELAGQTPHGRGLAGHSMLPTLTQDEAPERPGTLFWEGHLVGPSSGVPSNWNRFAVRKGRWKLVRDRLDSAPELYDIEADRSETTDLSATRPELVAELESEYGDWRHRVADLSADTPPLAPPLHEGRASMTRDWIEFSGGSVVYAPDSRLRVVDGDLTFQARIFPATTQGRQVIAELAGSFELELVGGVLSGRLSLRNGGGTALAGTRVLAPGQGVDVALTLRALPNQLGCARVYLDAELEAETCAFGIAGSDEPLRLGNDGSGLHPFIGSMWRPELRRNTLLPDELADRDRDGILDREDLCIGDPEPLKSGASSPRDTDADGFGNACDGDFDGDGWAGFSDYLRIHRAFGTRLGDPGYDEHVDLDGNGAVGGVDVQRFRQTWQTRPGPSGVACGGQLDCTRP